MVFRRNPNYWGKQPDAGARHLSAVPERVAAGAGQLRGRRARFRAGAAGRNRPGAGRCQAERGSGALGRVAQLAAADRSSQPEYGAEERQRAQGAVPGDRSRPDRQAAAQGAGRRVVELRAAGHSGQQPERGACRADRPRPSSSWTTAGYPGGNGFPGFKLGYVPTQAESVLVSQAMVSDVERCAQHQRRAAPGADGLAHAHPHRAVRHVLRWLGLRLPGPERLAQRHLRRRLLAEPLHRSDLSGHDQEGQYRARSERAQSEVRAPPSRT